MVDCPRGCGWDGPPNTVARHSASCLTPHTIERLFEIGGGVENGAHWIWRGNPDRVGIIGRVRVYTLTSELVSGPTPDDYHVVRSCRIKGCYSPKCVRLVRRVRQWEDYPTPVLDEETGCLRWQGPKNSVTGYGTFGGKGYAHQEAYRRFYGPIPEGMDIDHVKSRGCRHRDCVEAVHLEAVTHRENSIRGQDTIERGQITHCPTGHPYDQANLYIGTRPDGRIRKECRACRREYARAIAYNTRSDR